MTREEAILNFAEWIKRDSEMVNVDIVDRLENIEIYKIAIKALEQEPCEDCISRQAVIQIINNKLNPCTNIHACMEMSEIKEAVKDLEPVSPQRKTVRWVEVWDKDHLVILAYKCSECGIMMNIKTAHYCPNCGAKMRVNK